MRIHGKKHETLNDIRAQFDVVVGGKLGKISFEAEDRFIDPVAGKVMDSWLLRMWIGDEAKEERTMRGLDLLHWDGDRLVRKITYKQDDAQAAADAGAFSSHIADRIGRYGIAAGMPNAGSARACDAAARCLAAAENNYNGVLSFAKIGSSRCGKRFER